VPKKKVNTNKNNLFDDIEGLVDEKPSLWQPMPKFKQIKNAKKRRTDQYENHDHPPDLVNELIG
jgi:hypothetical protein